MQADKARVIFYARGQFIQRQRRGIGGDNRPFFYRGGNGREDLMLGGFMFRNGFNH
ncbi:hypothetical protein D3C71_1545060 [compost metagenome]